MLTTITRAAAATTTTTTTTTTKEKTQRRHQFPEKSQQKKQQQQQRVQQQNRQLLLFGIIFFIIILIFAPIGSNALPLTGNGEHSIEIKRYCSNNLSDAIRNICGGRYNSLSRQFPDSVGHGSIRSLQSLAPDEDSYFRPLTTGPVHECCRRPCGYAELKTYCAPSD